LEIERHRFNPQDHTLFADTMTTGLPVQEISVLQKPHVTDLQDVEGEDIRSVSDFNDSDDDEDGDARLIDLKHDAIKHVATYYISGGHGRCVGVEALTDGAFHEVNILAFADGWTCIGRFAKDDKHPLKIESEVATMRYVRQRTTIPVPEVYLVNLNPCHVVGAQFIIMQRIEGTNLCKIWEELDLDQKNAALDQVIDVMVQLSGLKFSEIGSLRYDGSPGPLCTEQEETPHRGPFSSAREFMVSAMPGERIENGTPTKATRINRKLKTYIEEAFRKYSPHSILDQPFRLMHSDFHSQNMLFTWDDKNKSPQLTGIIDWDWSRTALPYEFFEYPTFIQDIHWSAHLYADNKILRKYFVHALKHRVSSPQDRELVQACFRMKDFVLQNFDHLWAEEDNKKSISAAAYTLEQLKDGTAKAYEGRLDWEPDSEIESETED
jgi:hypothetical protein